MSEDPIGYAGGDTNLYRYVGNDPTNYRDPSGLIHYRPPADWLDYMGGQYRDAQIWLWNRTWSLRVHGGEGNDNNDDCCCCSGGGGGGSGGILSGGFAGPSLGSGFAPPGWVPGGAVAFASLVGLGGKNPVDKPEGFDQWPKWQQDLYLGTMIPGPLCMGASGIPALGKLIGWGIGAKGAIAKTATITAQEIATKGITATAARSLLQFYQNAVKCGQGGQAAVERVKLMEKILHLLGE